MKIVIIGNGMVGYKCCEKLIQKAIPSLEITVFGEESMVAYDRVHLSDYFTKGGGFFESGSIILVL